MLQSEAPIEAAKTFGPQGRAPALLLCEHASNAIPAAYGDLGLDAEAMTSHAAWDPGALDLAQRISQDWGLPLVYGAVSRLVYDCNRPPEAPDAIPARSEMYAIPGNRDLTDASRAARAAACATSALAAAFLVLESVDVAYLEGLGL